MSDTTRKAPGRPPSGLPNPGRPERPRRRSLLSLAAEVPELARTLVEREIELIKTEVVWKLKSLGMGAGLLAAAALVALFMIGVLLTAAVLGLAQIMPGWAAALIVAAVLLVLAVILGLIGYRILQRVNPPLPSTSIASLKRDINAIKGIGKRGIS